MMLLELALSLAVAQAGPALSPEIPELFRGEYNERLTDCGTGNNDSRLQVFRNRLEFYEATAEVRGLIRHADGSATIVADQSEEGETRTNAYHLRLADGVLTITHPQTSEFAQMEVTRRRCPAGGSN